MAGNPRHPGGQSRVRGFRRKNTGKGRQVNPVVRKVRAPGRHLPGAPTLPRNTRQDFRLQVYPDPPPNWIAPVEEWIVYWYFNNHLRWQLGVDWYYQGRIILPYFFESKDFTQADFIIPLGGGHRAGQLGTYHAIVLDPFTEYTHSFDKDIQRKQALDAAGYLLIFLAQADLEHRTYAVMQEALLGHDLSNRGMGI